MTLALPLEADLFLPFVPDAPAAKSTVIVTVYGSVRCGHTRRIRHALTQAGIRYHFVNFDLHRETRRKLHLLTGDNFATPVVHLDGDWLLAPSIAELQSALQRHGMVAATKPKLTSRQAG